jgi:hypothetical protein
VARKRKSLAEQMAQAEMIARSNAAVAGISAGIDKVTLPASADTVPADSDLDGMFAPLAAAGMAQIVPEAPAEKPESSLYNGYGLLDMASDTLQQEGLMFNLLVMSKDAGFEADTNWTLPDEGTPLFKELTDGLDEEHWDVFGKSVSLDHARFLQFKLKEELAGSRRMMEYGGTAGVIAANMLNPESIAMGIATGGFGWLGKGSRLVRAMKNAGAVALENTAVEASLYGMQETRDEMDILYGAVAGIALGGAFGAIGKGTNGDVPGKPGAAQRDLDFTAEREAVARGLLTEADVSRGKLRGVEAEIRSAASERQAVDLRVKAAGAPSRFDVGALKRQTDTADMHTAAMEARLPDIKARMLAEDVAAMGQKVATSKQRTKLRDASAKLEHDALAADTRTRSGRLKKQKAANDAKLADKAELDAMESGATMKDVDADTALQFIKGEYRGRYAEKLTAARAELTKALGLVTKQPVAASTIPSRVPAGEASDGFGADTLSAARAPDSTNTDVREIVPGSYDLEARVEFPATATHAEPLRLLGIKTPRFQIRFPRFGFAKILRGISNDQARGTLGLYVGDSVGANKGLNPIGASEIQSRMADTTKRQFHKSYEPNYLAWISDTQKTGKLNARRLSTDRELRRAFGEQVDSAVRFPDGEHHPAAVKAAAGISKVYNDYGVRAQAAGVKGFENFKADPKYAPRVYDWLSVSKLADTYGTKNIEDFVTDAIRAGFRKEGTEITEGLEKFIVAMGKGMYNTLTLKANGIEPTSFNALKLDDLEQIERILVASGMKTEDIYSALKQIERRMDGNADAGKTRYARGRTLLDEQYTAKLWNGDKGIPEEKSFRDLFMHKDAEQLFENYNRTMSGHIALAEQVGIRSVLEHDALVKKMVDLLPAKERKVVEETANNAYKLITGSPLGGNDILSMVGRRVGRALRDYNYVRVMNQVGFAQIPDAAAYLTPHYFKYARLYMPEAAQFMSRASDGTLDHKLAAEVEEAIATGTDYDNITLFSAADNEPVDAINGLEHKLRVGARITSNISGMRTLTDFNQRITGMAVMNRLVHNIMGKTSDMDAQRMLNLGLTPEKIARIKAMADQHVEFDKAGRKKLMALELNKWSDGAAVNDLLSAAHREARQMVQEGDLGDSASLLQNSFVKVLAQFRQFPLVAYSKQLGHGMVHGDTETLARVMMQVSLGSMSYAAQMSIYSLTIPEEERAEWREKFLSPQAIFFGGITRAGMFSIVPQMGIGAYQWLTGDDSLGNVRTTGLGAGMIQGVPAIDLFTKAFEFTGDIAQSALRGDREFDKSDFSSAWKLLPFNNAHGVKQVGDYIKTLLPDSDDDDDTEDTDWGLSDD